MWLSNRKQFCRFGCAYTPASGRRKRASRASLMTELKFGPPERLWFLGLGKQDIAFNERIPPISGMDVTFTACFLRLLDGLQADAIFWYAFAVHYHKRQHLMKRQVLIFGLVGGILITLLKWTEYRFMVL